ncbi:DUF333 domain-containing protein [Methylocystis sp. JAN1]|uniref:putative hemolysin n=1 Tax=Methylocystis sp. JAN1 TaxID=3397211 RepID=UPI003FA32807
MSYKDLEEFKRDSKRASRVRKATIAALFVGAFGLGAVSSVAFLYLVSPDELLSSGNEPATSSHLKSGGDSECPPSDPGCAGGMPPADAAGPLSNPNLGVVAAPTPPAESSGNQPEPTLAAKPADPFPTQLIPDSGAKAPIATRSRRKTFAKSMKPRKLIKSPASDYCHSLGGRIERRNGLHGQYRLCQLPDGRVTEEWRFYRSEHGEK